VFGLIDAIAAPFVSSALLAWQLHWEKPKTPQWSARALTAADRADVADYADTAARGLRA
jgi:hypothetical protein